MRDRRARPPPQPPCAHRSTRRRVRMSLSGVTPGERSALKRGSLRAALSWAQRQKRRAWFERFPAFEWRVADHLDTSIEIRRRLRLTVRAHLLTTRGVL